jgi:hypothetical protein
MANLQLATIQLAPKYNPVYHAKDGNWLLNENIESDLREIVGGTNPKCIVGSFWGDQHFFASTANSPRRFDFVIPAEPDLPLDAAAEIVPYDLLVRLVRHHFTYIDLLIAATQRVSSSPLYLLPAPPAVDDLAAIPGGSSNPRIDSLVAEHGLAPGWLRYKFWRMCHAVYCEKARAAKVEVLPIPAEAVDERGFRRPEYYSQDWIHANSAYGELVLKQCDELLARS